MLASLTTRTSRAVGAAVFWLAAITGLACMPRSDASSPPERIFLFVVDTLRRDHVGVYSGVVATPNIDRLARGGQVFSNASSSFHQTSMSMGAMFTGRTPSIERGGGRRLPWTSATWCGMSRFATPGDEACMPNGLSTLAERLRDAGYWTAGVVTNLFLFDPHGFSQGFDEWAQLPTLGRFGFAADVQKKALELLEARPSDRFFLYLHWIDVHQYGVETGYLPASYAPAVARFDRGFGELLDRIEELGLFDRSLVVFTSDHGERLGEEKAIAWGDLHNGNPSFGPVLQVPLIARPALAVDPDALVRSEDIGRMILAAVRKDGAVAGDEPHDLAPDELYLAELMYQTLRRGRFKATRRRTGGSTYLFDLERDPGETRDVAAAHPDGVAAHERRIDELASALASEQAKDSEQSDEDRAALRALGYLE